MPTNKRTLMMELTPALLAAGVLVGLTTMEAAHADPWNKWGTYLAPNPDSDAMPPAGLQLKAMTSFIDTKALTDTTLVLIENNTDSDINKVTCKSYTIAGVGSDARYHNPDTIPAHHAAIVNFDYATRTCSHNPISFSFIDGRKGEATGDGSDIYNSTRVVVSTTK